MTEDNKTFEDLFKEMYNLVKSDQELSEWSQKCDFKARSKEFFDEVEEIKEAIEKKDVKNLRDELGDALWDLTYTIFMAEKEGLFEGKDVIQGVINKIKRRKPWTVEGKKVSREEELKIWNEVKKREKNGEFD